MPDNTGRRQLPAVHDDRRLWGVVSPVNRFDEVKQLAESVRAHGGQAVIRPFGILEMVNHS
jgi:hypothetical protein